MASRNLLDDSAKPFWQRNVTTLSTKGDSQWQIKIIGAGAASVPDYSLRAIT
jgi:hypothetical protein